VLEERSGIRFKVIADNTPYNIDLATMGWAPSFLGHKGAATVESGDFRVKLGSKTNPKTVWQTAPEKSKWPAIICVIIVLFIILNLRNICGFNYQMETKQNRLYRRVVAISVVIIIAVAMYTFVIQPTHFDDIFEVEKLSEMSGSRAELIVIVTSLIGSGSELLKPIFQNSANWNYFEKSLDDPIFQISGTFDYKADWDYMKNPKWVKEKIDSMIGLA